jgi:peptidoglycan-associated lipoprotein
MKQAKWILLVAGVSLLTVGCNKNVAGPASPQSGAAPVAQGTPAQSKGGTTTQAKAAPQQGPTQAAPQGVAPEDRRLTPQQRADLNALLTRLEPALFDYDKATIRPDAATVLRNDVDVIRSILSEYPAEKLLIEGHADERGTSEYNLALGDRRAIATREFLSSMGVASSQLQVMSYGEERPVCTATDEACWQRNRRAHITVAP